MCAQVASVVSDSLQLNGVSPSGSSLQGILQARILEWVTIPSTRVHPHPGIKPMPPAAPVLQMDFLRLSHQESLVFYCGLF